MFGDISIAGLGIFIGILLVSISVHEMMHALVAHKLGDDLAHSHGRVSLNPLQHIDPIFTVALPAVMILFGLAPILAAKPVPINTNRISGDELGLAAVGLAGPLTNLAMASVGAVALQLLNSGGLAFDIVELFIRLNVALFVFNMMPIPPLDGSRLLYAFAPPPVQRVMEQIEAMGLVFLIMILIVFSPVLSPILIDANQAILDILIR